MQVSKMKEGDSVGNSEESKVIKERNNIGWKAKIYRIKNKLTIKELSERAGVAVSVIQALETNPDYNLKISSLIKIASALGVTLEELVVEQYIGAE